MLISKENKEIQKITINDLLKGLEIEQPVKNIVSSVTTLVSTIEPYIRGFEHFITTHKDAIKEAYNFVIVQYKTRDGFWTIHDRELIDLLRATPEDNYNEVITNYYKENNYAKIKEIYDSWLEIYSIKDRMSIISSCFNLMQDEISSKDLCNVIIPALTTQITGLKEDVFNLIPNKEEIMSNLGKGQGKSPSNNEVITEFLWRSEAHSLAIDCEIAIFNAVMLNRSKLDKLTKEDIEKYNKYRNKILHGDKEYLNYGTEENLVRSWLELDILIKTYTTVKELLQKETSHE